jgi:predicted O-methyltransferase YrrM
MRLIPVTDALYDYIIEHSSPADEVERYLIERTAEFGDRARMRIGHDQGMLFTQLTKLMGARQAIEIGTFTGYSALCIARGLPADGRLLTCDVNEEWTAVAREVWQKAGVADRIELAIGPALDTLRALPMEPRFDLAFVDADKPGYLDYYEELVPRIRPGGALLIDNVLWFGTVVDKPHDETAKIMRRFNDHVSADPRVDTVMLSIGDGVTLAHRRMPHEVPAS